jgi:hypothetical protein
VNVGAYLDRIGYASAVEPTHVVLAALQRAHMLTVPFENLDIALGRRLVLDRRDNYAKIVERRRGGWCFELNGLFGWLLEQVADGVMRHRDGLNVVFTNTSRRLEEFQGMSDFLQTSPDSGVREDPHLHRGAAGRSPAPARARTHRAARRRGQRAGPGRRAGVARLPAGAVRRRALVDQ